MDMKMMLRYPVVLMLLVLVSLWVCSARTFDDPIPLPAGAVGPETVAFDPNGGGLYVGVSDGRILRYDLQTRVWTGFAVMPNWNPSCLGGLRGPAAERLCGRPLGLKFHPITQSLYVADAYYGLVEVSPQGGRGVFVARVADGGPFRFTNFLDIHPVTGVIYFTDSSSTFERWNYQGLIDSEDRSGRLMAYNPSDQTLRVLVDELCFPNGVALSPNNEFLLISETTTGQIWKYWLTGPRSQRIDLLLTLGGHPDNINRDSNGNFWIAQVRGPNSIGDVGMPVKIDAEDRILERLDAASGTPIPFASDVKELADGFVLIGSVNNPWIAVLRT